LLRVASIALQTGYRWHIAGASTLRRAKELVRLFAASKPYKPTGGLRVLGGNDQVRRGGIRPWRVDRR
jgi:hypothetical protein